MVEDPRFSRSRSSSSLKLEYSLSLTLLKYILDTGDFFSLFLGDFLFLFLDRLLYVRLDDNFLRFSFDDDLVLLLSLDRCLFRSCALSLDLSLPGFMTFAVNTFSSAWAEACMQMSSSPSSTISPSSSSYGVCTSGASAGGPFLQFCLPEPFSTDPFPSSTSWPFEEPGRSGMKDSLSTAAATLTSALFWCLANCVAADTLSPTGSEDSSVQFWIFPEGSKLTAALGKIGAHGNAMHFLPVSESLRK